jgi:hypothetical protein
LGDPASTGSLRLAGDDDPVGDPKSPNPAIAAVAPLDGAFMPAPSDPEALLLGDVTLLLLLLPNNPPRGD